MRLTFVLLFLLSYIDVYSNDTLLVAFNSEMIFYNIEANQENDLFVGTSSGLFKIEESNLKKINNSSGYISFKSAEPTFSTSLNIERSNAFNPLLPPNYHAYQHQSYIINEFIYLIAKGSLFIYKINKHTSYFPGVSIRAFSPNSIGTYSGIYCYGDKLEIPTYTSGQILEKDSTFYICYDGIAVHKNGKTSFFHDEVTGQTLIGNSTIGNARELYLLKNKGFILSSTKGLYHLNEALDSAVQILSSETKHAPLIVSVIEENITSTVTFTANQKLYRYGFGSQKLQPLTDLPEIIEDGVDISTESSSEYLLLGRSGFYHYSKIDGLKPKTSFNTSTHTMALLSQHKVLITSQNGAYLYELNTNNTSRLFESIEFNKGALRVDNERVRMGTVDGYYELSPKEIDELIVESEPQNQVAGSNNFLFPISIALVTLSLIITLVYYKRKGIQTTTEALKEVNAENINDYIVNNLNQASVKSLCAHFGMSTKTLYKLTSPQKPGQLITELKIRRVKELLSQGEKLQHISQLSGYSVNYLKKLMSR